LVPARSAFAKAPLQAGLIWGTISTLQFEGATTDMSDVNVGRGHGATMQDYLRVARRRKWIIAQAIVLLPLVAVAFSLHERKLYRASAEVLLATQNVANQLNGINDPTLSQDADRHAQTQADLARVPAVARETLMLARVKRSVDDFLNHSSATAKTNADLLDLSVEDHRPDVARRLATAYAQAFSHYRAQLDTAPFTNAKSRAIAQLRDMAVAHEKNSPTYDALLGKLDQLDQMIALLTRNAVPVQTPDHATQVQPRPVRNGILGLVLGIVLGVALAFLKEALDTRVRTAEEIEERLGLPLLARIPEPARRLRKADELVMLEEPQGSQAETFRLLRTNLDFVRLLDKPRTILVTSALEREGKSTTSANLAVALARAGQRVALVDLDLRRPFINRFFDLRGRPGMTQIAVHPAQLGDAFAPLALAGRNEGTSEASAIHNGNGYRINPGELVVIGSGPIPPNPGEFVGAAATARVLEELRKLFDTVVIDTPPALQVGDAIALSALVDALIVVCRMKMVRRPVLNQLRRVLDTTSAKKLGFVLTDAASEEGYGYGYGYAHGYASSTEYERAPERERAGVS
jgi:succinoglycan biosynthesis transport protein ExoP